MECVSDTTIGILIASLGGGGTALLAFLRWWFGEKFKLGTEQARERKAIADADAAGRKLEAEAKASERRQAAAERRETDAEEAKLERESRDRASSAQVTLAQAITTFAIKLENLGVEVRGVTVEVRSVAAINRTIANHLGVVVDSPSGPVRDTWQHAAQVER